MGEPSKEATWILVDVSRSMASDIADVKGAVLDMLSTKIFHHKQDVVGILLLGTEKSENALNAEICMGNICSAMDAAEWLQCAPSSIPACGARLRGTRTCS